MLFEVVGIFFFFKAFLARKSKVSAIKNSTVADCRKETREERRGCPLFRSDPEALQAVDNEKISILITSYKAAVIPFNNPIGACPLSLSECTIVLFFF